MRQNLPVTDNEIPVQEVAGYIDSIASQTLQMASAVEEQSQVADQTAEVSSGAEELAEDLHVLVDRFRSGQDSGS